MIHFNHEMIDDNIKLTKKQKENESFELAKFEPKTKKSHAFF